MTTSNQPDSYKRQFTLIHLLILAVALTFMFVTCSQGNRLGKLETSVQALESGE